MRNSPKHLKQRPDGHRHLRDRHPPRHHPGGAGLSLTNAPADDRHPLRSGFFAREVAVVARELIGTTLLVDGVGGVIVETEAYSRDDPASHSYTGATARNASMFGPPGRAYVYRSYGMHWCLNAVCGEVGAGSAVLIRALAPTTGLAEMRVRRDTERTGLLCAGPGRLTQALAVTRAHDGLPLDSAPFELRGRADPVQIVAGARVGITRAAEVPWRFGLAGSPFLSRRFPAESGTS